MKEEIFYNRDNIIVRRSRETDLDYLKNHLRQSDVDEIWASHHYEPEQALKESLEQAIFALTVENGNPIAMFGIIPYEILGDKAGVWLLATDGMDKIKRRFAKHSRYFVELMLSYYPHLDNYVDVRNKASIKWLEFCGAKMGEPEPYGKEGLPFIHFRFDKEE